MYCEFIMIYKVINVYFLDPVVDFIFFNTWDFVEDGHGFVPAQGNTSHEKKFCRFFRQITYTQLLLQGRR